MPVRVGINGFGRIGRLVFRAGLANKNIEFVAANDLGDAATMAHLLKYDSVHGTLAEKVEVVKGGIKIKGRTIALLSEKDPAKLPWKKLGVDIVIESTGHFTDREAAQLHLKGGAKKVIISAPGKDADATVCMGVNEKTYDPKKHSVISNASCTTNCLAPVAKVLNDTFGIVSGLMNTVHSYTNDQRILDFDHKDLRRARAAALSIIPSTTGAAKAIGLVLPELAGKLDGFSLRVPTPNVSVVDLTCEVKKPATVESVNAAFRKAATSGPMKKVLDVSDEPLVSRDYNHSPFSSVVDAEYTRVSGNLVKVLSWYDNEWGYSNRVVDLAAYVGSLLK